jgi:hypothetical protein
MYPFSEMYPRLPLGEYSEMSTFSEMYPRLPPGEIQKCILIQKCLLSEMYPLHICPPLLPLGELSEMSTKFSPSINT